LGPDQRDVTREAIIIDSPMARALLDKIVDDEVIVKTPEGERVFDIINN
jgi:transcription elongation factor GreB